MVEMDKARVGMFLDELDERGVEVHALEVWQHGRLVASEALAPFEVDHVHPLFSVTKSFTSCAVGFLVDDGLVDVERPWLSWFPEYEAMAAPGFERVTVRDLLTMTMGQDAEATVHGDDDWAANIVGKPVVNDPGTVFLYNSQCSNLLSRLVQRVSGEKLSELVARRLFAPLGIERWWWEEDRRGHSTGGFGLHLSTPELARFGRCLLAGGMWEGEQVIPAEWVREATRKQVDNAAFYPPEATEDRVGYGYQFWMCAGGGFRCSGLHGQLCYVRPDDEMVVAASSSTTGSKALLDVLYHVLGEAERPSTGTHAIATPKGSATCADERVWGEHAALPNPAGIRFVSLRQVAQGLELSLAGADETYRLVAGEHAWLRQPDSFGHISTFVTHDAQVDEPPAWCPPTLFASYAWRSASTLEVDARALDSTRRYHILVALDGKYLTLAYDVEGLMSPFTSFVVSATL